MTKDLIEIEARVQGSFSSDDPTKALEHDHNYVKKLMHAYLTTQNKEVKKNVGPKICEALETHTSLEESVFYPHVKELNSALIERCLEDHQQADDLIRQMKELLPGEAEYDELMQQLHDSVMEHMSVEEKQLFTEVRDSDINLYDLALQMQSYESNLVAAHARLSTTRPEQRL